MACAGERRVGGLERLARERSALARGGVARERIMALLGLTLLAGALILALAGESRASTTIGQPRFHEKPAEQPTLVAAGDVLTWDAIDPTNSYLLRRKVAGQPSEFALVKGTAALPPAIAGQAVTYSVEAILGNSWSSDVSIAYPSAVTTEVSSTLTGEAPLVELSERRFFEKPAATPNAEVSGETLSWEAVDPPNSYVLRRKVPGRPLEYALVTLDSAVPASFPGQTVTYSVKAALGSTWSPEVSITYPTAEEQEKDRLEREEREKETTTGAVVSAAPTGPPVPGGGWHVAYADGFGAQLGTGAGQDNTWRVDSNNKGCCNNSNEIAVERPSQVAVGAEGLRLTCEHLTTTIEGLSYSCGGISGALCCTLTSTEPAGYHTPVITLGKGQTFAFQFKGKLPPNLGTADPGWWMDGPPWSESEFDFFEGFGWGHEYVSGSGWTKVDGCSGCWFASPHPELEKMPFSNPPAEPEKTEHTYTTYIYPSGSGYRFSTWIDGVRQLLATEGWSRKTEESAEVKSPREARLNLTLTYMLRAANAVNDFTSGSNSETVRSVAVYVDAGHAGVGLQDEGIAPGTSVK
jgi:hypothetical protein